MPMLPEHYPVHPGKLFAGEYPGAIDPESAEARLRALIKKGIRTFIDLTAPADGMVSYGGILAALEKESGLPLKRVCHSITDMGVPKSSDQMDAILASIREAIATDSPVYIHCWGGIGRTGTAVGCHLRETGLSGDEALARVQELYSTLPKSKRIPESPQTPEQKSYVRNWDKNICP